MNKTTSNLVWKKGMAFESEVGGHKILVDVPKPAEGESKGPSPKSLLLTALSGCTAMDVISILKKMKIEPENFEIACEANNTEEHPKYYNEIKLIYKFKGENLDRAKIEKAVSLSIERYCGVNFMLNKAAKITTEIEIIS